MRRFKGAGLLMLASALACSGSGCATMIHGKTQRITITSNPSGAKARVAGQTVITPAAVVVGRKDPYTVVFLKEGYQPQEVNLYHEGSGLIWVNLVQLVPFCAIGMRLDDMWGGAYNVKPSTVTATLRAWPAGATMSAYIEKLPAPLPSIAKTDLMKSPGNAGRARICVLQKESVNPDRMRALDGEHAVGVTSPKTFLCWERQPGLLRLTADTGYVSTSRELKVEAGRTYFVSMIFDRFAKVVVEVLSESEARALLDASAPVAAEAYVSLP